MGSYQRINPVKQKAVESKKAFLIGGGIASLSAAAYMIRDGHMQGKNITVFEELDILGGAMDGKGDAEKGYIARGGRELEEHYECMFDLWGFIPSLKDPSRTVLDEIRELNIAEPVESHSRLTYKQGKIADFSSFGLKDRHVVEIIKLMLETEERLGTKTIEQYFDKSFLETNFYYFWRSMFAFENWHSVVEVRRYMRRFIHLLPGMNRLWGILHTEYNQYDSMILPLITWLKKQGVRFELNTQVVDIDITAKGGKKTVTGIHILKKGKESVVKTAAADLVFVTNGSMTENSTYGDNSKPPVLNRDTAKAGCWSLWKKIAAKGKGFGRPEVFCGDIDKTKWESFTMTFKGKFMADYLGKLTDRKPGMAGVVTVKDSNWLISWTVPKQPHFPNQPKDVFVVWAYGLFPDAEGNFIKKKMSECTGLELVSELLYHMGLEKKIKDLLPTVKVIPCMMPYITSQFMPRVKGDRPDVIPEGSVNLAFLGQFAEQPDDCVFTVEYSVRTAMTAVYRMLNLEKEVIPVFPSFYDIRTLTQATKVLYGGKIPGETIAHHLLRKTSLAELL
ncbi:oleate hydratase [Breznakiella homolactica]|uniref:Oleate hydratase n=1 Tax=Breznakiella homolactica TaxID=2798577 RepID=A0A7T8B9M7_9SPIR|nr:oleate hydratase [Breznakiella homolactica]QQO08466.1 oleate hydratase [Breznakiella homolactica]